MNPGLKERAMAVKKQRWYILVTPALERQEDLWGLQMGAWSQPSLLLSSRPEKELVLKNGSWEATPRELTTGIHTRVPT